MATTSVRQLQKLSLVKLKLDNNHSSLLILFKPALFFKLLKLMAKINQLVTINCYNTSVYSAEVELHGYGFSKAY